MTLKSGARVLILGMFGGALALVLAVPGRSLLDQPRPDPRARARALHAEAMDRLARLDVSGWIAGLQAALAMDSSFAPALLDFESLVSQRLHPASLRTIDSIARRPDHPLSLCARALADGVERRLPVALPPGEAGDPGCRSFARYAGDIHRLGAREQTELRALIWRAHPGSAVAALRAVSRLAEVGDWGGVVELTGIQARSPLALIRVGARGYQAVAFHHLGRHDEALDAERRADDEVLRGGEGLRAVWMAALSTHGSLRAAPGDAKGARHRDSAVQAYQTWAAARPVPDDPWLRSQQNGSRAKAWLDAGDLAASLRGFESVVSLADSIGDPRGQAVAYMLRGRAAVKAGALTLAEQSLLAARKHAAAAGPGEWEYEVEHNLLHLYEGLGRWADARRAGARFVEASGRAQLSPVRMMSHRDFAWFLRRRGEWEAAQREFEAMVATNDSLSNDFDQSFYLGEYYESTGDLDRARAYYSRVASEALVPRVIEALTRLAEATSDTAAAIAAATRLEQIRVDQYPEHRPLLPGVLARAGRHAEALRQLERTRRQAAERGQVASWARLSTELARVEHDRGAVGRAARLGDSAAAAARQVGDQEFALRATAIAAAARARSGDPPPRRRAEAARFLGLRREAHAMRAPALEFEIALLEGQARAALGDVAAALGSYRRAQGLADSIARGLALDPSRAGFRAAQLAPSTYALALSAATRSDPRAVPRWVEWSARRKGRDLPAMRPAPARLAVPSGVAVVDYAVLDSTIAALVVTDAGASLAILPITPTELRRVLAALYARLSPRVGSALDRARARLDGRAIAQLGAGLLTPLRRQIGTAATLILVPDGPLHLVPFDALPVPSGDTTLPALERYTILTASTLGAALAGPGEVRAGAVVTVSGDATGVPVPGLEQEVAAIQSAMAHRSVRTLDGAKATEHQVRISLRGAGILHLAAHARPNYHNPDLAEVRIAAGGGHDGRLQAHEIRTLPLTGMLVVLSACETATGRVVAGEGSLSLSRAFLQAGARHVIATLWPVGDATANLMATFYRELDAGRPPAAALREAKRAARAADVPALAWAPFTLLIAG